MIGPLLFWGFFNNLSSDLQSKFRLFTDHTTPVGGGGGVLGSSFAGYVPLASLNPQPIIVYSVANYRPHLGHFWANVIVISRTEFNASGLLDTKKTAGTIFQPQIFLFLNPCLLEFSHPEIPKMCDPILETPLCSI